LKCSAAWESSSSLSAALAETVRLRNNSDITRREEAAPIDEAAFSKAYASPSVRKFARELGADLGRIKGTGVKGRITQEDVKAHVKGILAAMQAPAPAAAAAATRAWSMGRPFHAERKLSGLRLAATDHPWQAGQGLLVEGPIAAILLLITGRPAALRHLSGPGRAALVALLPAAAQPPTKPHDDVTRPGSKR